MNRTTGVIGLGLIGGSLAKALKSKTANTVYGLDINEATVQSALAENVIDAVLNDELLGKCDMLLIALYPADTIDFVKTNIKNFKKGAVIIDCAGVKSNICESLSEFAVDNGVYFIGGHPMAGKEKSGFEYSSAGLFDGAAMILCKDKFTNIVSLKAAEALFLSIGFGKTTVTSAAEHDEIIAFTSQLAHVVSNAFIQSETAKKHIGFSAGSYKDLTRVAWLDENMWTELFLDNKSFLTAEIESLIKRLEEYAKALNENDAESMKSLLVNGKKAKEDSDSHENNSGKRVK